MEWGDLLIFLVIPISSSWPSTPKRNNNIWLSLLPLSSFVLNNFPTIIFPYDRDVISLTPNGSPGNLALLEWERICRGSAVRFNLETSSKFPVLIVSVLCGDNHDNNRKKSEQWSLGNKPSLKDEKLKISGNVRSWKWKTGNSSAILIAENKLLCSYRDTVCSTLVTIQHC